MLKVSAINLLVDDYQQALEFYRDKLGFYVIDDISMDDHRWLTVSPESSGILKVIINKAETAQQKAAVGNQTGGCVLAILQTDNFDEKYQAMLNAGVEFCEKPREEEYGTVVIFKDLYGNKWDLIELTH
ncbi:VOC family protein [Thalassotalea sp. M1531]|uniref:VOC family protein n=1 Tax=Thalassotalea algicola TaxID=2716224 RepID=A0A7Y0Q5W9_9GAMM|nr:VOC family protein [Thalassotalea algicola]NMP30182.1 VOC family protein [Thalassotalea algicola]